MLESCLLWLCSMETIFLSDLPHLCWSRYVSDPRSTLFFGSCFNMLTYANDTVIGHSTETSRWHGAGGPITISQPNSLWRYIRYGMRQNELLFTICLLWCYSAFDWSWKFHIECITYDFKLVAGIQMAWLSGPYRKKAYLVDLHWRIMYQRITLNLSFTEILLALFEFKVHVKNSCQYRFSFAHSVQTAFCQKLNGNGSYR